jgi:glutamine cyclotransferase
LIRVTYKRGLDNNRLMKKKTAAIATVLLMLIIGVSIVVLFCDNHPSASKVVNYTYSIVKAYPHDTSAFTQGLVYQDGFLYEGTGLNGYSSLRRVDLNTGQVLQQVDLDIKYFGEGIAVVNNSIIQLTWQSQVGFVYDKNSFSLIRNFSYVNEGWGLTFDGEKLIMSDGTSKLRFVDPISFKEIGEVLVHDAQVPVVNINELEYVNGDVYANIWMEQKIAIIDLSTGLVKGWVDLSGLQRSEGLDSNSVLNGIAYDSVNCRFFVTGKNWPMLFEIKLIPLN